MDSLGHGDEFNGDESNGSLESVQQNSSKKYTKSQDACGTFHAPFLMKLDLGVIQNDLGAVPKIVAPAPVSAACGSCKAGS